MYRLTVAYRNGRTKKEHVNVDTSEEIDAYIENKFGDVNYKWLEVVRVC